MSEVVAEVMKISFARLMLSSTQQVEKKDRVGGKHYLEGIMLVSGP